MNTENENQGENNEEAVVVSEKSDANDNGGVVANSGANLQVKRNKRGKIKAAPVSYAAIRDSFVKRFIRVDSYPDFRPGDTVKVHSKIVEGAKERIQIFQGVIIRRCRRDQANATFTVRKVSNNVGVERVFYLHSPRVEKIELVSRGKVRRAKLYFLRDRKGKAARIKQRFVSEA